MYLSDYHVHSSFSHDSKEPMDSVCKKAVERGLSEICFTEHYSFRANSPDKSTFCISKYADSIAKCREKYKGLLTIKMGLEIGELQLPDSNIDNWIANYNIDFILGSVHSLQFKDESVGLITFCKNNSKDVCYKTYFEEIDTVSLSPYPNIVAHLDLMKRYAFPNHGNYDYNSYKEMITTVLTNIIALGKGIEVNTSSLRSNINETMPGIDILKLYYELGGRIITVGSDSHVAEHVGCGLKESLSVLKSIGFTHIYTFSNRKAIPIEIEV